VAQSLCFAHKFRVYFSIALATLDALAEVIYDPAPLDDM
jgi:hypothetical protein